jgi:hypothetical protein
MYKKLFYSLFLWLILSFGISHAVNTRSQDGLFDVKERWTTYYHVTRQDNLESIRKEGLLTFYGGMKQKQGMSILREDDVFIKESMNHVHVATDWETANRYAEHMLALREKALHPKDISKIDMPVFLKCDTHKGTFSQDPHDVALRTKHDIHTGNVFILVIRPHLNSQGYYTFDYTNEDKESFWLPLANWNPSLYKPAYPETDKKVIQLDESTIRQLLAKRIERYSHQKLNKGMAAKEVGVCSATLDKFLHQDLSLLTSTKQKIINNFCQHFASITHYDYHFIKR